jgi:hypothetical protein
MYAIEASEVAGKALNGRPYRTYRWTATIRGQGIGKNELIDRRTSIPSAKSASRTS